MTADNAEVNAPDRRQDAVPLREAPPEESQASRVPPDSRTARHALRTPINHIVGYCELLIDEAEDNGWRDAVPDLQKIRAAAGQLTALINDITANASAANVPGSLTAPQAMPSAESASEWAPRADHGRILVVDDNDTNRELLARRLEREGHEVVVAGTGQQALDILARGETDVVLLDIVMSQMNGFEVLQRVKADEKLRHVPVIVVSALDEMDSVVRSIEMGAEDYLTKPIDPVLLRARINAGLEKKRLRDREVRLYEELQSNFKRLKELENLRDDLTHMMVHDLRTPLTSVITGVQTLSMLGDLTEDQQTCADLAVRGGRTLLGMINDLLDVSKMESGSLKLDTRPISPTALVENAIRQVEWLAQEKRLQLAHEMDENLPVIQGDESKLERVLVNLLGNAIKFTPAEGRVTVSARHHPAENAVVFSVRDTGEGIPKESFERIFEKFGQVETRKAGRKMSTGLGLTFCKMAVEAHAGHIWVESALGVGSAFSFTVPVA